MACLELQFCFITNGFSFVTKTSGSMQRAVCLKSILETMFSLLSLLINFRIETIDFRSHDSRNTLKYRRWVVSVTVNSRGMKYFFSSTANLLNERCNHSNFSFKWSKQRVRQSANDSEKLDLDKIEKKEGDVGGDQRLRIRSPQFSGPKKLPEASDTWLKRAFWS